MKKEKNTKIIDKKPIIKYKNEEFQILEHSNQNIINGTKTKTVTPYVKLIKCKGGDSVKHVEVGHFTPLNVNLNVNVSEKEWLKKSVEVFNTALVKRTTVVIEKTGDKIKLSIFHFKKSRRVGHRYFAKHSSDLHITFNTKTKNFYITNSTFASRKRWTSTTKNDFSKIVNTLNNIHHIVNPFNSIIHPNHTLNVSIDHMSKPIIGDNDKLLKVLRDELKIQNGNPQHYPGHFGFKLGHLIIEWFINVRGIKVPNDYYYYMVTHYPGIKKLKKNKMNLVTTILNEKKLNGNYYKKLLNYHPEYNLTDLVHLKSILGDNGITQINKKAMRHSKSFVDSKFSYQDIPFNSNGDDLISSFDKLTKYEIKNVVSIYNTSLQTSDLPNTFINTLLDHLTIKHKLKKYGINKKIKSKTKSKFDDEHNEWSNLVHICERSKEVKYHYPPTFLNHMEKDVTLNGETYKVVVLKNDTEYFNEGQTQHHCVRTYLDRYGSIIVSIRKTHTSGLERMTCEFTDGTERFSDRKTPRLVQVKMKYNQLPTQEWEILSRVLQKHFLDYACKYEVKPIIEITNKINAHKEILTYNEEQNSWGEVGNHSVILDGNDLPF